MNSKAESVHPKQFKWRRYIALIILASACFFKSEKLLAEVELDVAEQRSADQVFESVTSPFCPGRLLKDCPSSAASELKDRIRLKVKQGESPEQVIDYLLQLYGQELLAVPRWSGVGLLAWTAPFLFLLLGATFIFFWLARRKSSQSETFTEIDQATRAMIERQINPER